ncbi:hypothetical protein N7520_006856 [Penicillium odoratum]|uniref:uncharacterized protein n=1 Tax=Penicillium odoratum TaxID=1167516 RepID=UPI002547BD5F|nr:uncharacterized protein N7520_006856 [Penicillium odoratum]KAJ5759700.1 hypothetical protein N7520_006856 [Penicillium odoratum]
MEILHSLELRVSEMEATEVPLCPLQEIITSAGNLSQSPRPASLFEDPFTLSNFDFNVFDDLWPREQVGNLGWLA